MTRGTLQPPDSFHLDAAQGWLGLGNHHEATLELQQLSAAAQSHPDVLEMRWRLHRIDGQFAQCTELAAELLRVAPDDARGWLFAAQTHYFQQHHQLAYDTLSPALAIFPAAWPIHYDMSCYACLLGQMDEARRLLAKAFSLDTTGEARRTAANDPDLQPLREVIDGL